MIARGLREYASATMQVDARASSLTSRHNRLLSSAMTEASSRQLHISVIEAFDLPTSMFGSAPNCYVAVCIDKQIVRTKTVKGVNPAWNEVFVFDIREASVLFIQVFHDKKPPKLIAERTVDAALCLQVESQGGSHLLDLLKPTKNSKLGNARISISCRFKEPISGSTSRAADSGQPFPVALHVPSLPSPATKAVAIDPKQNLNVLEELVLGGKESVHMSTPSNIDTAGAVIAAVPSDNFGIVMGYVERFVQIGDAISEVHPYAKLAWKVLMAVHTILKAQQERDGKVRELWGVVLETLDFMKHTEPLREIQGLEKTVQCIMKQIYDCVLYLRSYGERGFLARTVRDTLTVKTDDAIQQFTQSFSELKVRFRERMDVESWKIACTTKEGVVQLVSKTDRLKELTEDERLESLPGVKLGAVQWDPDRVCLPGTRSILLDEIIERIHSPTSERIIWLSGAAGTGKSSIANSIAEYFDSLGRLGASFRFDRHTARPETPGLLFGNICHQLALFDDQLRVAVLSAIRRGCGGAMSLRRQAKTLLVETTQSAELVGPVVIVIDGLDESGTDDGHEPNRQTLVRAIVEELPALPPSVKVLITSRDEGKISLLMSDCPSCLSMRMEDARNTHEDILRYIQYRMTEIRRTLPCPLHNWPGATREEKLARYADGLFIWASVACAFLERGDDPDIQLAELVSASRDGLKAEEKLDVLYLDVLRQNLPDNEGILANNWNYVVGALVALKEPLTYRDMDSILNLSAELQERRMTLIDGRQVQLTTCYRIISFLRPILRIDANMKDVVRLLHKSVFDFLTQRADITIRVDLSICNAILAKQCLEQMNRSLRYDICGIGDLSLLISEVDGLPERIDTKIPGVLRYACRHFANHLNDIVTPVPALRGDVDRFVTKNLLYWIEVMGILNGIAAAEGCLCILARYVKDTNYTDDTAEIINDALSLLRNCGRAITLSPLQTYASAIPLTPKESKLYQAYYHMAISHAVVTSSHPLWISSLRTLEGHTSDVRSVVFSPDGSKLASASYDYTVRLWDVETGAAIGSALEGHTSNVYSVVFSPDGSKLASSSSDNTVRLWDVETGVAIGSALVGHTSIVYSVIFLPDGSKLASASADTTVRLWDVETGAAIGSALEGHTSSVNSVAFSPDGSKLASASWDHTVRLWDVETGAAIGSALEGHTSGVYSVVFSPDGSKLASASGDTTVRLWDVETGAAIGSALEGHTAGVKSVVFSPDGSKLASASYDRTVHLWDVETGAAIGSALEGHTSFVNLVVFSPDGSKLASASWDHTVRLWDVETGAAIGSALQGHTSDVNSVVFSPDGSKLASASYDNTVRLWDVETGAAIGSALEGHTSRVNSVVFSPDGSKLASASWDNTVRLWDVEAGVAIGSALEGHTAGVKSVVFSPDGSKLASASADKTVRLWDVETRAAFGSALEGHISAVNSVVFSPDGSKLASASSDNTVRLWDVETGAAIGSALEGHTSGVKLVVFSPDGSKLASTSIDGTVHLWDTKACSVIMDALDTLTCSRLWRNISSSRNPTVSSSYPFVLPLLDSWGFLRYPAGQILVWLPANLRGHVIRVFGGIVAVGGRDGAVTFVKKA